MIYANVWRLISDILKEKYHIDRLELALNRTPRRMCEYLSDYMHLHYELNTLATKQTNSLLAALEELYELKHPYATLFCRMLGILHARPFPLHAVVCLTLLHEQFDEVSSPPSNNSFAAQYEILQYGGQASIIDLMELTMKICHNNREVGERII